MLIMHVVLLCSFILPGDPSNDELPDDDELNRCVEDFYHQGSQPAPAAPAEPVAPAIEDQDPQDLPGNHN